MNFRRLSSPLLLLAALTLPAVAEEPAPVDAPAPTLEPPEPLDMPNIAYPEGAPAIERPVVIAVNLWIAADGHVRATELVSGAGEPFDHAVLHGVLAFLFKPARWGGEPTEVVVPFTHTFLPPPPPVEPGAPEKDPRLTAKLHGLVLEKGTRKAVAGATVIVSSGGLEQFATTDAAGKFSTDVVPGDVEVRISSFSHRKFLQRENLADHEEVKLKYLLERQSYSPYETVVVGSRERTEISRTTLQGRELTHVPGTFGDPFRVVQVLPGVTSVMGLLPLPIVRGSSPGNTGFFLDQVKLPLLYHLFGGPSVVHPEFVDRIDFYPGGFPVMYGGYTGGIVDGLTRAGRDTESRLDLDLNLVQTGALARVAMPSLDLTTTVAGRIGYPGVLLSLLTDELSLSYWDYQVRVDRGGAYEGWTAFFFGASDTVEALQPAADDETVLTLQRVFLTRFHRGDLRWRTGDENRNAMIRFFAGWDETAVGPTGVGSGELVLNPQLRGELRLDANLRLYGGLDGNFRRIYSNLDLGDGEIETPQAAQDALGQDGFLSVGGLFLETQWRVTPDLLVVPGFRTDLYHQADETLAGFDPRVMARWKLSDAKLGGTTLKGSVGIFHQPPRLPISIPGLDQSALALGLLASTQTSIGAEMKLGPALEIDVQTYFNWMDPVLFDLAINADPADLIASPPEALPGQAPPVVDEEPDLGDFFKGKKGRSYGLEILLRKRDADGLFGWIAYTLSHSQRLDERGWNSFDFDRRHILNLVAGLKLPRNWEFGARVLYQTGTPLTTLYGYNANRSDPQLRVDLRIDKRAVWNRWLLDFYIDIINVVVAEEAGGLVGGDPIRYVIPTVGFRAVL